MIIRTGSGAEIRTFDRDIFVFNEAGVNFQVMLTPDDKLLIIVEKGSVESVDIGNQMLIGYKTGGKVLPK